MMEINCSGGVCTLRNSRKRKTTSQRIAADCEEQDPLNFPLPRVLGPTLVSGDGSTHATTETLAGVETIGIYFSANWCVPCQSFTLRLKQFYEAMQKKSKGFKIIFVSSDYNQAEFDSYLKSMPWLAMPFSERNRKTMLSARYKAQSIPMLVLLDAEGDLITRDGHDRIMQDVEGVHFPWKPSTLGETVLRHETFVKAGKPVGSDSIIGKTVGVYFSASWSPQCRAFTAALINVYNQLQEREKGKFEVVLVSSDGDESSFDTAFAGMPWLAVPFAKRDLAAKLTEVGKVQGVPSLVILAPNGKIINPRARESIETDATGSCFPWNLPPYHLLCKSSHFINIEPTLIVLVDGCNEEGVLRAEEAMEQRVPRPGVAVQFALGKSGDEFIPRIREKIKLGTATNKMLIVLVDFQDAGAYYIVEQNESFSPRFLEGTVDKFMAGGLTRQQM